jgi:hypothetical protein
MCPTKVFRILNQAEKEELESILENYLQSKKTWWGRIPNPIFDEKYFNEKIVEVFQGVGDEVKAIYLKYFTDFFGEGGQNRKDILYYFDKGSIFSNIYYSVYTIVKKFFFGKKEDQSLETVKEDFDRVLFLEDGKREEDIKKEKENKIFDEISNEKPRKPRKQRTPYTLANINYMVNTCSVVEDIISENLIDLSNELHNLSGIKDSFRKACNMDDDSSKLQNEALENFLNEFKIVLKKYAELDEEAGLKLDEKLKEMQEKKYQIKELFSMLMSERDKKKQGIALSDPKDNKIRFSEDADVRQETYLNDIRIEKIDTKVKTKF